LGYAEDHLRMVGKRLAHARAHPEKGFDTKLDPRLRQDRRRVGNFPDGRCDAEFETAGRRMVSAREEER